MCLSHLNFDAFSRIGSLTVTGSLLNQLPAMNKNDGLVRMFALRSDTIYKLCEDDLKIC